MRVTVHESGYDPIKAGSETKRRHRGGSLMEPRNLWIIIAVVVFVGWTVLKNKPAEPATTAAAPVIAAQQATPTPIATPPKAPDGWCIGPLTVAGYESIIKPGFIYAPGRYVLELNEYGIVLLAADCTDETWTYFKPQQQNQ